MAKTTKTIKTDSKFVQNLKKSKEEIQLSKVGLIEKRAKAKLQAAIAKKEDEIVDKEMQLQDLLTSITTSGEVCWESWVDKIESLQVDLVVIKERVKILTELFEDQFISETTEE